MASKIVVCACVHPYNIHFCTKAYTDKYNKYTPTTAVVVTKCHEGKNRSAEKYFGVKLRERKKKKTTKPININRSMGDMKERGRNKKKMKKGTKTGRVISTLSKMRKQDPPLKNFN